MKSRAWHHDTVYGSLKMPPTAFPQHGDQMPASPGKDVVKELRTLPVSRFTQTRQSPPVKGEWRQRTVKIWPSGCESCLSTDFLKTRGTVTPPEEVGTTKSLPRAISTTSRTLPPASDCINWREPNPCG